MSQGCRGLCCAAERIPGQCEVTVNLIYGLDTRERMEW